MNLCRMDNNHTESLHIHGITLDPAMWKIQIEGQPVFLTSQQFRIVHLLMRNAGRFFTRRQILESIHNSISAADEHLVESQISAIRKKLGNHKSLIRTRRGLGYGFQTK